MHSDKNDNGLQFPWRAALHYIFALLLFGALAAFVNCHRARFLENPKRNTMTTNENISEAEALSIHHRAIIVDMHADTAQRLVDEDVDLNRRLTDGHLDAVRAREGGLDAQFFSIWVEPELFGGGGARAMQRADLQIEAFAIWRRSIRRLGSWRQRRRTFGELPGTAKLRS